MLVFARADAGDRELGGSLTAARHAFSRTTELGRNTPNPTTGDSTTLFGRASLHYAPLRSLILRAGGSAEIADATIAAVGASAHGDMRNLAAFLGAEWSLDPITARAAVSLVHLESTLDGTFGQANASTTRLLAEAGARARIAGPLALRASVAQSAHAPTVRDLVDTAPAARPLTPEHAITFELGPSLHRPDLWVDLIAFFTRIDDALEPSATPPGGWVNVRDVEILGAELSGGALVIDRLRFAAAATWAEGVDRATNAPAATYPNIVGRASLRYDFSGYDAFIETHVKGATNALVLRASHAPDLPPSLASPAPAGFVRFGLQGGAELGLGFSLHLLLENVLDTAHRTPSSLVPAAGVDLRAALSYAFR